MVDTNVLLDILDKKSEWHEWSSAKLAELSEYSPLLVNPIIYAEVSVGFARIEDLDAALPTEFFRREALPWAAGFLAGKVFVDYRRRGGTRLSPLPDFYIGAHAVLRGSSLLTRDVGRFRTYFPTLALIAPN